MLFESDRADHSTPTQGVLALQRKHNSESAHRLYLIADTLFCSHSIDRDVEDIQAVLVDTGSRETFGMSSGGMIVLESARQLVSKELIVLISVCEAPFYPDGIDMGSVRRLNKEIEDGDLPSALITALITLGAAPLS